MRQYGSLVDDTLTRAAHQALTQLAECYHIELGRPFGYLSIPDQTQPEWRNRIENLSDPEHVTYDPDRAVLAEYSAAMYNLHDQVQEELENKSAELAAVQSELAKNEEITEGLRRKNKDLRTSNCRYECMIGRMRNEHSSSQAQSQTQIDALTEQVATL